MRKGDYVKTKRILVSPAYLELLGRAIEPGTIHEVSDFAGFLNQLKQKLKAQGRIELFDQLIREEIHMLETVNPFI